MSRGPGGRGREPRTRGVCTAPGRWCWTAVKRGAAENWGAGMACGKHPRGTSQVFAGNKADRGASVPMLHPNTRPDGRRRCCWLALLPPSFHVVSHVFSFSNQTNESGKRTNKHLCSLLPTAPVWVPSKTGATRPGKQHVSDSLTEPQGTEPHGGIGVPGRGRAPKRVGKPLAAQPSAGPQAWAQGRVQGPSRV